MKLTKIQIRNYRGVETLDINVSRGGLIAKGGNSKGKSSILKAIRSVLEARDISADAIRIGHDRAELLVDIDNVSVRRVITAKTSTLAVEKDGMKASKPTTYLRELLGSSSLDPLEIYLSKPKERRSLILAALPCVVTKEQLNKYVSVDMPLDIDLSGHGLEAIERLRAFFYAERTEVNREAAEAKRTADRLAAEAQKAAASIGAGPLMSPEAAHAAVKAAERELHALDARAEEAEAVEARTSTQRARVESLREEADVLEKSVSELTETGDLEDLIEQAANSVSQLEQQLTTARTSLSSLEQQLTRHCAANDRAVLSRNRAADLRVQAETLATALSVAKPTPVSDDELTAVTERLRVANEIRERAGLQEDALKAIAGADAAKQTAQDLQAEAHEYDVTVKRLTNDAPAELLSATDAIKGLTLNGDEVLLDGVSLDALSGSEQLKFAVEIARRANVKTRILVVDGLERLDVDQLETFIRHATRDDWQLLGSLVTGGELVVAAIEPDETAAAAE